MAAARDYVAWILTYGDVLRIAAELQDDVWVPDQGMTDDEADAVGSAPAGGSPLAASGSEEVTELLPELGESQRFFGTRDVPTDPADIVPSKAQDIMDDVQVLHPNILRFDPKWADPSLFIERPPRLQVG